MRAFLGWAYKAVLTQNVDPQASMCEHSGLVHFLTEMYSRVSVKGAKPMSECGQGNRSMLEARRSEPDVKDL